MSENMVELEPEEEQILGILYSANKPLPTERIAIRADMAWQTAKRHLHALRGKGIVERKKIGRAVYWWLRTE